MNGMIPQISVIVPVYKAEAYLHRCVDSILAQTYQDFEVLLIDDGSPDRSGEICDVYAQKDRRVRVFHKENGGVSSARNCGIQKANGCYICFVDSDDSVGVHYLEHLMNGDFDITLSGLTYVLENGVRLENIPRYYQGDGLAAIGLCIPELETLLLLNGPCQKRFKKNLVLERKICFDESCSNGEDTLFVWEYMQYIRSIMVTPYSDYFYYRKENGTLSTQRSTYQIAYNFARKMFSFRSNLIEKLGICNEEYWKYVYILYVEYLFVSVYSLYHHRISRSDRLAFLTQVFKDNKTLKFVLDKRVHLRNMVSVLLLRSQRVRLADWFYKLVFALK